MRRECFPRHRGLAIPICITARNARAVMHAGMTNYRFPLRRGKRSWHFRCMRNPQFAYLVGGPRAILTARLPIFKRNSTGWRIETLERYSITMAIHFQRWKRRIDSLRINVNRDFFFVLILKFGISRTLFYLHSSS